MIQLKTLTKKNKIIAGIAITVLLLSSAGAYLSGREEVTLGEVTQRDIQKIVEESGSVESESAVTISAKGSGTIGEILVVEGQKVEEGDLLISFSDFSSASDVAGIKAQAAGVYAQYAAAKNLSDNNKILYEQGAISYITYSQSLVATQQLSAQLSALGYSAESVSIATAADGITSPISGVVTAIYVKEGETAGSGFPLAEVGGVDDRIVSLHLISTDADLLAVGMKASVYAEENLITDQANVSKVSIKATDYISSLGIAQKRVLVEVAVPKDVTPRLGSSVDVQIVVSERTQVLSVPENSLFTIEEKNYVYVVKMGKAVLTPVDIGLEGEDYTEIMKGLSEGMQVIISPSTAIGDGVRVKEKR